VKTSKVIPIPFRRKSESGGGKSASSRANLLKFAGEKEQSKVATEWVTDGGSRRCKRVRGGGKEEWMRGFGIEVRRAKASQQTGKYSLCRKPIMISMGYKRARGGR